MSVLDKVSELPTDLIRKIKDTLDIETYTELLLCEKYINKEVKKTVKDQYYETYVDDVNGTLEYILTNRIPAGVEKLDGDGNPWHFQVYHPLKIPDELQYNIFQHNLYNPLLELVKNDKLLSGVSYIGIGSIRGLKMKEQKHPLLQELKNLISDYYLMNKPSETNERVMERYNTNLEIVMKKLKTGPKETESLVYLLRGIRSFNNEFDNKVQRILLKYLKALVVLTKPYCRGLVSKLVKEQTTKDTQIDEDREMWQKDLKKAVKEVRMMGREERYEKRRLELVKRNEIIESRREARRKLTEERREKKKAELKKKKEIAKEKERKKKEKAKEKERKKKLLAKLKAKNAKEAEKAAKEAVKRKAKLAAKALKKAVVMERTLTASLPSVRKLFK